jgi:hypothetical protein
MGMCKLKVQIHNGPNGFVKKIKKAKHHLVKSKKKIEGEFIRSQKEKEKLREGDI